MKNFQLMLLIAATLFSISCNNSAKDLKEKRPVAVLDQKLEQGGGNIEAADTTSGFKQNEPPPPPGNPAATVNWDKKIIKTADLKLEVKNYSAFNASTRTSASKYGAYISQETQNQSDYKIENVMTIRVPVDQFDNLVSYLTSGDATILEKRISSEDVTGQLVDTKARLEAKKQARLRYLEFMKQAKNMEEVMNVQKEVDGIQEEIEAAAGRIDFLAHSASFSTVNLTYFQVLNPSAPKSAEPAFRTKAWESFKTGWEWMGELLVTLISIWPLFIFAFICWLLYRKFRSPKFHKPTP